MLFGTKTSEGERDREFKRAIIARHAIKVEIIQLPHIMKFHDHCAVDYVQYLFIYKFIAIELVGVARFSNTRKNIAKIILFHLFSTHNIWIAMNNVLRGMM